MAPIDLATLAQPSASRIVLIVMDGLGGYADRNHGTELEEASTPHLDQLADEGAVGLVEPVGPGIGWQDQRTVIVLHHYLGFSLAESVLPSSTT